MCYCRAVRLGKFQLLAGAAAGIGLAALLIGERRWRLRIPHDQAPARLSTNLALGAASSLTATLLERLVVAHVVAHTEARQLGLVRRVPAPRWVQEALAFLLLDYSIYLWHVATHKVPLFWRFHLVHHSDLALDSSTALRFHAIDMVVSAPFNAAQVRLIGPGRTTLALWRAFFFASVLFHHSNLRLPRRLEARLSRLLTTPRMHGIHHTAIRDRTDANWSSGLSIWDHLHGTFRLDVPQAPAAIGVPAMRDPGAVGLGSSLRLPFEPPQDAWRGPKAELAR